MLNLFIACSIPATVKVQMKTIEPQNLPFYSGKLGKQVKDHIKNLSQNISGSKALYARGNCNSNSFNWMEFTVIWWFSCVPCSPKGTNVIHSTGLTSKRLLV